MKPTPERVREIATAHLKRLSNGFVDMQNAVEQAINQALSESGAAEGWVSVPAIPSEGRLISMALRYRHDFGLLADNPQQSILSQMKQLYEEAIGAGFYSPEKEEHYKAMIAAAGGEK